MFGKNSWLNIALHGYGQGVITDLSGGVAEDGRPFAPFEMPGEYFIIVRLAL